MDAIERTLSYFTKNQKAHDVNLFTRRPAFASHPSPTIHITSSDCGSSHSSFDVNHTEDGAGTFPTLTWKLPENIDSTKVAEYLFVVEDADAPLFSTPPLHGSVYRIPSTKTDLSHSDLTKSAEVKGELTGGMCYAKTLTGAVYGAPRPLKGHGPHRYFYQIVALKESLGVMSIPAKRDQLAKECEGKVLAWGEWIGVAERK